MHFATALLGLVFAYRFAIRSLKFPVHVRVFFNPNLRIFACSSSLYQISKKIADKIATFSFT